MFEKNSQGFGQRPHRYQTRGDQPQPKAPVTQSKTRRPQPGPTPIRFDLVFWGALSSFVVFFLFFNLQAISDLAPESVKNGDTPGAFGVPAAILTIVWIAAIPVLFVRGVYRSALSGKLLLNWFATGAFVGVALGVLFLNLST